MLLYELKKSIKSLTAVLIVILVTMEIYASGITDNKTVNNIAVINEDKVATYSQPIFRPTDGTVYGKISDTSVIKKVKLNGNEKYMCLTFDSAYNGSYTYNILDILDAYGVKATFFMTGEFIKNHPTQVIDILSRGHEIGNHSTTHKDFTKISTASIIEEVTECNNNFKEITGMDMCLFRFPYGYYGSRQLKLVRELGYFPIQWTADSSDWKNESVEAILARFENQYFYKPGNILLFHNGAMFTTGALPKIIEDIQAKGIKLVRVSDMIYKDNFYIDFDGVQKLKEE